MKYLSIISKSTLKLSPNLFHWHACIWVLIDDLCHCHLKILLCDMHSSLTQRIHSTLSTNTFDFCSWCPDHHLRDFSQINISCQIHFTRVNLQNFQPWLFAWCREFNLTVNATWTKESLIQNIDTICCHYYLMMRDRRFYVRIYNLGFCRVLFNFRCENNSITKMLNHVYI